MSFENVLARELDKERKSYAEMEEKYMQQNAIIQAFTPQSAYPVHINECLATVRAYLKLDELQKS